MRFLPEQRKKTIQSLIILAVAVLGIVYFNFFMDPSTDNRRPPGEVVKPAQILGQGNPPGPQTQVPQGQDNVFLSSVKSKLLPYGARIDVGVLSKDAFKILKNFPKLSISPEDLGKSDPFSE